VIDDFTPEINEHGAYVKMSEVHGDVSYLGYDLLKALAGPIWKTEALCRSENAEHLKTFFPEEQTHGGNHLIAPRKMCIECPVRFDCLEYGLEEPYGVWGGHSPSQRKRIVKLLKTGSSLIDASRMVERRASKKRRTE
jgi:hypothetical protein